ncbi:hypothetical protein P43SY_007858 [Pythium insidiosum]|uniref:Uncharacterized protein n=1 Tax=Pythium insidiosum TaxID=114742 RepID=A0AAD5QBN1_PYTIN|nr:hypothetical protein P43SY_007858 [Pythium insidiosum]
MSKAPKQRKAQLHYQPYQFAASGGTLYDVESDHAVDFQDLPMHLDPVLSGFSSNLSRNLWDDWNENDATSVNKFTGIGGGDDGAGAMSISSATEDFSQANDLAHQLQMQLNHQQQRQMEMQGLQSRTHVENGHSNMGHAATFDPMNFGHADAAAAAAAMGMMPMSMQMGAMNPLQMGALNQMGVPMGPMGMSMGGAGLGMQMPMGVPMGPMGALQMASMGVPLAGVQPSESFSSLQNPANFENLMKLNRQKRSLSMPQDEKARAVLKCFVCVGRMLALLRKRILELQVFRDLDANPLGQELREILQLSEEQRLALQCHSSRVFAREVLEMVKLFKVFAVLREKALQLNVLSPSLERYFQEVCSMDQLQRLLQWSELHRTTIEQSFEKDVGGGEDSAMAMTD